ncbi:hypothetical protein BCR32DRAFT_269073 [Anaeromyces robustus]|uniref:Uncharacterized protein n=1 Tax=Anaeromyces robustus TaxID=1754192 RepID=A0A1Y1X2P6_9FUNG|nr:hypothetical protein BCR32DRAFT_269073 [Anaeromyces robustus]|eukprot:ORX80080.1 hypothetical protein BCR32DRAFT_269073 [Anaeromyces robustus]
MSNLYSDVITSLSGLANSSRFLTPIYSWLLITYVFFTIGIHTGNNLWKYLYIICTNGVISNLFYGIGEVSRKLSLNFEYTEAFIYFKYPEHIFFALNEWGLIYLNFVKIRSCIKTLESSFWKIFINILFIYYMGCHLLIAYYEIYNVKNKGNEKFVKLPSILYIPVSILEIYFMLLIVISTINENNDQSKTKDTLTIFLNSSLTRMFIVSLILCGVSIIECVDRDEGYGLLMKRVLWRLKGLLGVVYLIDFLLIRVKSDSNTIKKNEVELLKYCIKEKNYEVNNDEKGKNETFGLDLEDPYGLNKTPTDYIQTSKIPSNINTYNYNNSPTFDYNRNENMLRYSSISDFNSNGNMLRYSSISDFNGNGNMFRNSFISDNNNENILKPSPISEYNRDSSLLMPKEKNTQRVSNIVTLNTDDIYSPTTFSNTNNRNSYRKRSYNIQSNNKNNGEIKFSPTFSYTNPEL